jgi:DNA-binding LytR/AlgR family response regulator
LFVKDGSKLVSIDLNKVLYFKSEGNYISVVFEEKKILSLMTMKDLIQKLPSHFLRVHRSYIINLDAIQSINNNWIEIGGQEIPVSQSYEKELLDKINFLN